MNTLPSNQAKSGEQSRSRRFARNINNNVTNLKNKLASNFGKHCRLNKKTNQETSFIGDSQLEPFKDVDMADDSAVRLDGNLNGGRSNANRSKLGNSQLNASCVNRSATNDWPNCDHDTTQNRPAGRTADGNRPDCRRRECVGDQRSSVNCPSKLLDHNENYEIDQRTGCTNALPDELVKKENSDSFDANFDDLNFTVQFDDVDLGREERSDSPTAKNDGCLLGKQPDQNDKIINEFLLYTNKLANSPSHNASTSVRHGDALHCDAPSDDLGDQQIQSKDKETYRSYYNCSDKVLDASALPTDVYSTTNRHQSMTCLMDEPGQCGRSNRLQSNANGQTNQPSNAPPVSQPRVVLRKHVRKEAMDVKSARKQVSLFLVQFFLVRFLVQLSALTFS